MSSLTDQIPEVSDLFGFISETIRINLRLSNLREFVASVDRMNWPSEVMKSYRSRALDEILEISRDLDKFDARFNAKVPA